MFDCVKCRMKIMYGPLAGNNITQVKRHEIYSKIEIPADWSNDVFFMHSACYT